MSNTNNETGGFFSNNLMLDLRNDARRYETLANKQESENKLGPAAMHYYAAATDYAEADDNTDEDKQKSAANYRDSARCARILAGEAESESEHTLWIVLAKQREASAEAILSQSSEASPGMQSGI